MKVSEYIIEFLIQKGIEHVFGYPGGTIAQFVDSLYWYRDRIHSHVTYTEQGAAFAACGYSQVSGKPGFAYSIGGPGATNLLTGIGHAWYDSIPLICLTGNTNAYESSRGMQLRQRGFQECDNTAIAAPITKYCAYIEKPEDIKYHLEKAYHFAVTGRRGPVLLDLPMNVARADINPYELKGFTATAIESSDNIDIFKKIIAELFASANRPLLILGNGAKADVDISVLESAINNMGIPFITSMIAVDILPESQYGYGYVGASGSRCANFIAAKSDLILSIGSRLDIRQVGAVRNNFAPNASVVRVDIDSGELEYKLHSDDISFCMDAESAFNVLSTMPMPKQYEQWNGVCKIIYEKTKDLDIRTPNKYMHVLSDEAPADAVITTDVGQNQVWSAQSYKLKNNQIMLFSGGFGAMGHALPSAVGAYYGSRKPIIAIAGDGGIQMNIQELQTVAREGLPVKIVVLNNHALGMIRHFQEVWCDKVFFQTKPAGGYSSPSFSSIAKAYGIDSIEIVNVEDISKCKELLNNDKPALIEIQLYEDTYEYPKLKFGMPNQDQEPLMDRSLYNELMSL